MLFFRECSAVLLWRWLDEIWDYKIWSIICYCSCLQVSSFKDVLLEEYYNSSKNKIHVLPKKMENRKSRYPSYIWKQWYLWSFVPTPCFLLPPLPGGVWYHHGVFHIFILWASVSTASTQGRKKMPLSSNFCFSKTHFGCNPFSKVLLYFSYKLLQWFMYVFLTSDAAFCLVFSALLLCMLCLPNYTINSFFFILQHLVQCPTNNN